MRFLLLLVPLILFLAGCASISEDECRAGDWSGIGFEDGKAGRGASFLSNHAEACAEIGVTPDKIAWEAGRIAGLKRYCTPQNAYEIGRQGREISAVCPAAEARLLARANDWGEQYHDLRQEIEDLKDERGELRALLATLTGELTEEQQALRRTWRERLRRVEDRIFELDIEIRRYDDLPQSLIASL